MPSTPDIKHFRKLHNQHLQVLDLWNSTKTAIRHYHENRKLPRLRRVFKLMLAKRRHFKWSPLRPGTSRCVSVSHQVPLMIAGALFTWFYGGLWFCGFNKWNFETLKLTFDIQFIIFRFRTVLIWRIRRKVFIIIYICFVIYLRFS